MNDFTDPRKPPYKKGGWKVTRFCCSSGLCIRCHNAGNHGNLDRRARVIHTYGVSREWAEYVAGNWREYFEAKAEPMRKNDEYTS